MLSWECLFINSMEMNLEKCLVMKNIHTDFTQWLVFPFIHHSQIHAQCLFAAFPLISDFFVNSMCNNQLITCNGNLIILLCFAVLAIILVGLLYGFFIAIICGQRINERHYHVLAKQELTKVCYVIVINAFKLL